MSYIGIYKFLGLSEKQFKMVIVGGIALLLALFFLFWLAGKSTDTQVKQRIPFVFTGNFPETLNEKRSDVMVIENFEDRVFDYYIYFEDFNASFINWQKGLPDINAWFIDGDDDKVNISRDVLFRDDKMMIYFATTEEGQNTSWKYKGGHFIVSMNIVLHGFKLKWE